MIAIPPAAATCPGPVPEPRTPRLALPAGACDAHCHIFGPTSAFPYAPERTFTPPEAPKERLQALHRRLGLARAVIVQSACHGTDHSALIDALTDDLTDDLAEGRERYRGVAIVDSRTSPAQVRRLHEAGVRGARLHFAPHLGAAPAAEEIRAVVELVRPYGWHIALHVQGEGVALHRELADSLSRHLPVVIDHMGRVDLAAGLGSPAVRALRGLLATGRVWVKLSGADRLAIRPPRMDDAAELAALLVRDAPERVLWGTDFPHPNTHGFMPDDGDLTDLLTLIAPEEAVRRRLLVDNPAECFGFGAG